MKKDNEESLVKQLRTKFKEDGIVKNILSRGEGDKQISDRCDEAIKWLDAINQLAEVEEFNKKQKEVVANFEIDSLFEGIDFYTSITMARYEELFSEPWSPWRRP